MKYLPVAILAACSSCAHVAPMQEDRSMSARRSAAVAISVECVYPQVDPWTRALLALHGIALTGRMGSGVVVGPGHVMTARHVVDCDIELPFPGALIDGEATKITVASLATMRMHEVVVDDMPEDRGEDVALLVVVNGAEPFPAWSALGRDPKPGQYVCVVASIPFRSMGCGPVVELRTGQRAWMRSGYAVYAVNSMPGNSGSGVYDEDGRLVAIHVASVGSSSGGGFLVSRWRGMVPEVHADLGF